MPRGRAVRIYTHYYYYLFRMVRRGDPPRSGRKMGYEK